jgi:hypothetical protein
VGRGGVNPLEHVREILLLLVSLYYVFEKKSKKLSFLSLLTLPTEKLDEALGLFKVKNYWRL